MIGTVAAVIVAIDGSFLSLRKVGVGGTAIHTVWDANAKTRLHVATTETPGLAPALRAALTEQGPPGRSLNSLRSDNATGNPPANLPPLGGTEWKANRRAREIVPKIKLETPAFGEEESFRDRRIPQIERPLWLSRIAVIRNIGAGGRRLAFASIL